MSGFDPTDYAADPESLPIESWILECLQYGVRFRMDANKECWFAEHPTNVTSGKSQVTAARAMLLKVRR